MCEERVRGAWCLWVCYVDCERCVLVYYLLVPCSTHSLTLVLASSHSLSLFITPSLSLSPVTPRCRG